jgi:glyoxylase-like metal-dependent hydrolase (beta-lactamase superfamily II)
MVESLGDGLHRIRLPLPWRGLDHVWAYALEADAGWTLVDAGLGTPANGAAWAAALAALGRPPIARLLVTHAHTDHVGGSADVVALTGCELACTAVETAQARNWHDPAAVGRSRDHLARHGCPPTILADVMVAFDELVANVRIAPTTAVVAPGDLIEGAGEPWRLVAVPGHADGMVALYGERSGRLLASDAMLASIAPFVGFHPSSGPDPLGAHLRTQATLAALRVTACHAGHGEPIADVAGRAAAIVAHHRRRLDVVAAAAADGPTDAYRASIAVYGDRVGPTSRRLAVVETLAHLVHLERDGVLERAVAADGRIEFRRR